MPIDDNMNIDERRKYLRKMQQRYQKAERWQRSQLLDEMEAVTQLHRKSLIRLMGSALERRHRKRPRGPHYSGEVRYGLSVVVDSFDGICAERIFPELEKRARQLGQHGELTLSSEALQQLSEMSLSTFKRMLRKMRQDQPRPPRVRARPARGILPSIPMRRIPWNESQPGHFEVDLTHQCGPNATGEYLHTLQLVDVATGWSERVAILGRSYLVMKDAFYRLLARLPFPILELHPDNGSEFLNEHLLRFWKDLVHGVDLTRSRPYHKNDNRFVEQKNSSLVRRYLAYARLDTVAQTKAVNQLFDHLWLFDNFFQPVLRLKEKRPLLIDGKTTRIARIHDAAQTPFDRLCQTGVLLPERQAQLTQLRERTNPYALLRQIRSRIDHIFALPCCSPGQVEDVALTLTFPMTLETPSREGLMDMWTTAHSAVAHMPTAPTTTSIS